MKKWWIGCSGFSYKHWKGIFYPQELPAKKWFEYYCEMFNTVELNVTFYRMPSLQIFSGWYKRSPSEFRFTVKAPRLITHYKRFRHVSNEVQEFYSIISRGLQDKLGMVLFQLHPRFEYTEENLQHLLDAIDDSFTNAIEFRHPSWWVKPVYDALKERKVTFCSISYPGLPDDVIKTAPQTYYRFHGVPDRYRSPYSLTRLNEIASEIKKQHGVTDVYAYFNNDIDVFAVKNAKELQTIARAPVHILHA